MPFPRETNESGRAGGPVEDEAGKRPQFEVRELCREDLEECAEVFVRVFSQEPWNDRWPSRSSARNYLSDIAGTPGFLGFVAVSGGRVIGIALGHQRRWWQGDEYSLDEFCVDVPFQGVGVGTCLLEHVERYLAARGVRCIVLLTRADVPAAEFYRKLGFEMNARLRFWHKGLDCTQ